MSATTALFSARRLSPCPRCGRDAWPLRYSTTGGGRFDVEPSTDRNSEYAYVMRVDGEGQDEVVRMDLLSQDQALALKAEGTPLFRRHACVVPRQEEEGPKRPWSN
jgi:hypothetical protein